MKAAATWEHASTLRPDPDNPVIHTDEEVAELRTLIDETVWTEPIVCRVSDRQIIAGHRRLAAALLALQGDAAWQLSDAPKPGLVPVRFVDVDEKTARRLNLASNALAKQSAWDEEVLSRVLREMDASEIVGIGFDEDELRRLLEAGDQAKPESDPDEAPEPKPGPPDSQPGQVYELGPHRLVCGDSTKAETWTVLLGGERIQAVWTDPPYGVNYVGKTADALTIDNDSLDNDGLDLFLGDALDALLTAAEPGAPIYVAAPAGPRGIPFAVQLLKRGMFRQRLVWVKSVLVLGHSDYHYRHEDIYFGYVPGKAGRRGRGGDGWFGDNSQTSVLEFDKPSRNAEHPTMKPVALVSYCLGNSTKRGWLVGEPFAGSGTTLIACAETGRVARCIELDPTYCDVIRRRWTRYAKEHGLDPGTGALDG